MAPPRQALCASGKRSGRHSSRNLRDKPARAPIFPLPGRPYRLAVRTPPFHGGSTGSIPVRVASFFAGPPSARAFPQHSRLTTIGENVRRVRRIFGGRLCELQWLTTQNRSRVARDPACRRTCCGSQTRAPLRLRLRRARLLLRGRAGAKEQPSFCAQALACAARAVEQSLSG